jgi:hypothetical protein
VPSFSETEITLANSAKKDQSNAQLKNLQRAADGKAAMADYEAEAAALRAKTERLKALRLAREATEPAPPAKRAATAKAKSGKKQKGKSGSLSDWLKDQEKGGRRT